MPSPDWTSPATTPQCRLRSPSAAGRDVRPLNYFEPRGLYVLSGVVALGALLLVTSASRSAWQALGLPLTSRFQIDTIAANARKPEFTRLWDLPAVGDIAVLWWRWTASTIRCGSCASSTIPTL